MKTGIYKHFKGGFYRVLFTAQESTNDRAGRAVVVYISLTNGKIHTRDLAEFQSLVGLGPAMPPRFTFMGEDFVPPCP